MENPLIAMTYREIQAQKEYAILITKQVCDLFLDITEKCPSRLLIKDNDFIREYFFNDEWQTSSELMNWIKNEFFKEKIKTLKEKGAL